MPYFSVISGTNALLQYDIRKVCSTMPHFSVISGTNDLLQYDIRKVCSTMPHFNVGEIHTQKGKIVHDYYNGRTSIEVV